MRPGALEMGAGKSQSESQMVPNIDLAENSQVIEGNSASFWLSDIHNGMDVSFDNFRAAGLYP
jgi:hypothetical protein